MGFQTYRPAYDWSAKDFYTGGEKPFESLAEAPKQIFGALEYKRQKEIEDQERQLKHEQELKDYQLKQDTLRSQQDSDRENVRQHELTREHQSQLAKDERTHAINMQQIDAENRKELERMRNEADITKTKIYANSRTPQEKNDKLSYVYFQDMALKNNLDTYAYSNAVDMIDPKNGANFKAEVEENRRAMKPNEFAAWFHARYQSQITSNPQSINVNSTTLGYERSKRHFLQTHTLLQTMSPGSEGKIIPEENIVYNGPLMERLGKERTSKKTAENKSKPKTLPKTKKERVKDKSFWEYWSDSVIFPSLKEPLDLGD